MKLLKTGESKGGLYAQMELMERKKNGDYAPSTIKLRTGDMLSLQTGLDMYGSAMVQNIYEDCVAISTLDEPLYIGSSAGVDYQDDLLRAMIKATIMEHLEKEVRLRPLGIKVLSLFFLEHVADYSSDGIHRDGLCARIFEEEYARLSRLAKYASLYDPHPPEASAVHNGYFSITKRKRGKHLTGGKILRIKQPPAGKRPPVLMNSSCEIRNVCSAWTSRSNLFFPLGPERRMGQPQCLSGMCST